MPDHFDGISDSQMADPISQLPEFTSIPQIQWLRRQVRERRDRCGIHLTAVPDVSILRWLDEADRLFVNAHPALLAVAEAAKEALANSWEVKDGHRFIYGIGLQPDKYLALRDALAALSRLADADPTPKGVE